MDEFKKNHFQNYTTNSYCEECYISKDKDECAKWKFQDMRHRIDNNCHDQKIMARVQEELKSYDEDELFNGDTFADKCLDLHI